MMAKMGKVTVRVADMPELKAMLAPYRDLVAIVRERHAAIEDEFRLWHEYQATGRGFTLYHDAAKRHRAADLELHEWCVAHPAPDDGDAAIARERAAHEAEDARR